MAFEPDPGDVELRWEARCQQWNSAAARVASIFGFTLVPLFAILDYIVSRENFVGFLIARVLLAAYSLFVFFSADREFFRRHVTVYSVILVAGVAMTISAMVAAMDGFASGYYAGINLVMLAAGLLFLWKTRVLLFTYGLIALSYVVPNVPSLGRESLVTAISNNFFLFSTAIIVSIGQVFSFRFQRRQFVTELSLQKAKDGIEHAHEQLKQLDKFKSQFFANITHELKTPLAMILSPLEMMIGGDLGRVGDQQQASLQSMFRSGMKLLKLIQDLLDMSKLEESRIRLKIAEHDMVEYLGGLVAQLQPLTQRKGIEMAFEHDRSASRCWCDIDRMERVFVNLLSNAAKFTPEGGHIRVSLAETDTTIHVTVADDGPGFPADKADKVFERFYQVDMAGNRKYGGTGIGLALAKDLVGLHGGRIWAESEVGKGATFHVMLVKDREHFRPDVLDRRGERKAVPDGKRAADRSIADWSVQLAGRSDYRFLDIAEVTERRVVERDTDEGHRQYTVLVVDDTPDIIRLVHLALRQQFKVMTADDGVRGLELATREPPNLIVTDFMMPNMDGMEMTRRLRLDPRTRHIPIIMLTARGDLEDRVAGLESGVNHYLAKPFSPKELLTTARSLLNVQETQADLLLAQRMDSLERVASGLAHEINNPLNYIKNAVDVIRVDSTKIIDLVKATAGRQVTTEEAERLKKLDARVHKMFETAEAGVRRISGTVDLMRKYSREGYTRTILPHDVFTAARQVVDIVLPATGREVAVELSFEGDGTVDCVPEELNQVLSNLVQNAIEAVADGTGRVVVTGRATDGEVVLSVKDNGPGIPPEVRDRIFTPFFTTKGPGKGMGLGLTITWRVVKAIGGEIDVASQPGQGTEFVVRLPRVRQGSGALPLTVSA
jgi:signal transduction histidine kinase